MMELEKKILQSFYTLSKVLEAYFNFDRQVMAVASFKTGASGNIEIVTEIDREVEEICINFFLSLFPEIPVFAEEHYKKGDTLPNSGWVFVIDPIDGTTEFVKGSNEWSVSLAAIYNLVPYVGMLFMPQESLRLAAYKGGGVTRNGEVISLKEWQWENKKIAVSPRQIQIPEFKSRIRRSGFKAIPISTLTIKIVAILLGRVDAGVYFPQEGKSANVWDYAASLLLLEELGGKMTSLDGSPMPFDHQRIIHREGWLASNRFCDHGKLLVNLR